MQRTMKYLMVLIVLILFGTMTGEAGLSKTILPQEVSPTTVSTPVAPAVVVSEPTQIRIPQIRILFTGDINLGRCIAKRTLSAHTYTNDYNYPFQLVAEELRAADITVGSLDGSLSDESPPMPCPDSTNLIGPTRMVEGLQLSQLSLKG